MGKAATSTALGTLTSRVLGFGRDVALAGFLGGGVAAEAFIAAFRLPNLFRRIFAEGAFSAAFTPMLASRMKDEEQARRFAKEVLSMLSVVLFAAVLLGELGARGLVWALAGGFAQAEGGEEKLELATWLTRVTFPYLGCMGLAAFYGGVLHARGRFYAFAAAPALLNVMMILAVWFAPVWGFSGEEGRAKALAWSVLAAGVMQVSMLAWAAKRAGWGLLPGLFVWTKDVRVFLWTAAPVALSATAGQINAFVGSRVASSEAGALAWLYYAERLWQAPLGLVGAALGVALIPTAARRWSAGDKLGAKAAQATALRWALGLGAPAAVGLWALSHELIRGMFGYGVFGEEDVLATASALRAYAVGLPGYVAVPVLAAAFFARGDTRGPLYGALCGVGVNMALALTLFPLMGHEGVAYASSAAGWTQAIVLSVLLLRRGWWSGGKRLWLAATGTTASAGLMGWGLKEWSWAAGWAGDEWWGRVVGLATMVAAGAIVYGVVMGVGGVLTGALDWRGILAGVRRRRR